MIPANKPLTAEEIDRLAEFLDERTAASDGMSLEMLDGYLHAVIIGPETITPSEWLPLVWSADGTAEPVWRSADESEETVGLVMRHMNSIAAALRMGGADWMPFIPEYENKDGGPAGTFGQDWALGFLQGVELRRKLWKPLEQAPEFEQGWAALRLLAYGPGDSVLEERVRTQKQRDALIESMLQSVDDMCVHWLEHAQPEVQTFRHEHPQPGRNDPCPCGSGKKYKRCCGLKDTH